MSRIEHEKQVITQMIKLYCKKKHHTKDDLCAECVDLNEFAHKRLSHCRHGENKTFCSACPTHCYAPKYRIKIKEVMKFSGPRMLFYKPSLVINHLIEDLKHKRKK